LKGTGFLVRFVDEEEEEEVVVVVGPLISMAPVVVVTMAVMEGMLLLTVVNRVGADVDTAISVFVLTRAVFAGLLDGMIVSGGASATGSSTDVMFACRLKRTSFRSPQAS